MANTYTTSWNFVNDGDTTTEDPRDLVGENNINIISSQIQWQGSETTESYSCNDYSTNTKTASATANETSDSSSNTDSSSSDDNETSASVSVSFPSVPSGASFDYHTLEVSVSAEDDGFLDYDDVEGTAQSTTFQSDGVSYSETVGYEQSGTRSAEITDEEGFFNAVSITATTGYTEVSSDTSCESYPSVPSGYNFNEHYYREEKNGSYQDSDYTYTNSVGNSRCVTSNDPSNTWTLEMETQGVDPDTCYNYYDTENPSVSGDVSASSSETLTNNETSNWYTLSGFTAASNSISHNISGSNEAYYRIEFDWEYALPSAQSVAKYRLNGSDVKTTLANSNDEALDYGVFRIYVDGVGTLVFDLVDPDTTGALPFYVYHPTHGKLALRERQ